MIFSNKRNNADEEKAFSRDFSTKIFFSYFHFVDLFMSSKWDGIKQLEVNMDTHTDLLQLQYKW